MMDDSPKARQAEARRQARLKSWLLFGILMTLSGTLFVRTLFEHKKEAALEAQAKRPEAIVARALEVADRAVLEKDYPAALAALERARLAVDQAAEARPDVEEFRHSRVMVRRRLAYMARQLGQHAQALAWLDEGLQLAQAILTAQPALDRARTDALNLLLERVQWVQALDENLTPQGRAQLFEPVVEQAQAVLAQVQAGFEGLSPPALSWMLIAKVQQGLAQLAARRGDGAGAAQASLAAVAALRAAERLHEDPREGLQQQTTLLSQLALLLDELDAPKAAEVEAQMIAALRLRAQIEVDPQEVRRQLGVWLGRLAYREAAGGRGEASLPLLEEAVQVRRALVAAKPAQDDLRRDLVRALSALASHHSEAKRDEAALAAYAQAVEAAEPLGTDRSRLVVLGNYAQVLGRLDRMAEAKPVAAQAWQLAQELVAEQPQEATAQLDAARAGLRHARLLRAQPKADRRAAQQVLRAAASHLKAPLPKGAQSTQEGIQALAQELGVRL